LSPHRSKGTEKDWSLNLADFLNFPEGERINKLPTYVVASSGKYLASGTFFRLRM
jgi:hypothetical protein